MLLLFVTKEDTVRVIWALGEADPVIDDIFGVSGLEWHGAHNRGSHSLHMRGPPLVLQPHGIDVYTWDVRQEEVKSNNFYPLSSRYT